MDTKPLRMISGLLLCIFTVLHFGCARDMSNYYGKLIGSLHKYGHNIKGNIYAADDTTIFIKGFWYDGTGTDAYFWVGNSSRPSPDGYIVPYPEDYKGRDPPVLKAYNNSDIVLKLPQGKRLRDIKWLSVWCRRFTVNFGGIFIPPDLEVPKPRVLPEFSRMAHGLRSGNISILDSKTLYIPNLHYDGAGPDAYFWVGNGSEPNTFGIKVPNEMGSLEPLRGYQGEDIEIVLPGNLTVYDIDWLAVWCVLYRNNFGHVMIPKDLDIPPALGQTKITTSSTPTLPTSKHEMSNCKELLEGRLQVQWEQLDEDVRIQILARIGEEQYAAFGLSGQDDKAEMLGADIVVVGYNKKTGKFMADDYYISHVSECDGKKGVCPDERIGGRNDALLLYGERKDGVTSVTYIRPLRTNEPVKDQMIPASEVSVIAAIGPLNARGEAGAHRSSDRISRDMRIDFGSRNVYECSGSLYDIPDTIDVTKPWSPAIIADENTFSARIGPTGGNRRYSRIKGETPWDIAWYINDLLLPEIVVERGETYTFIVEGGDDTSDSSKYHPFYITDDPEGGFGKKDREEQAEERIFAGVAYNENGYPYPTAVGRYCEWVHKTVDMSKDSETFEKFFETLKLECDEGEPAKMTWVVAEDTPDLVYYQCYTLNNLGWKIQVVDAGYKSRDKMNSTEKRMPVLAMMVAPIFAIWIYFR